MAVTRINNNQISDASAGNIYVGINAAVKLQNYSVTATKIANNLTYGSDLTITGNLTVQGNTTTIDTTYTTIEDPVILLASNQTGSPSVDIGFIGERGTSNNIAFVWDESAGEFVTAFTGSTETNTTITISSYASLKTLDATVTGNLSTAGYAAVTGNVTGGNLNSNAQIVATGNITGGNISTVGQVTATGNVTGGNLITGAEVVAAGNITGGNVNTAGQVVTTGNITGGNLITAGLGSFGTTVSATGNITGGNLGTAGQVAATGNVTGGNVNTAGQVVATGNITGGNLSAGSGNISTTGNVNVGNLNAATGITAITGFFTGNVDVLGNLNASIGIVYANSGIFYGNSVTGNGALFGGIPGFTTLGSDVVVQFAGNANSYSQINFENINSGTLASTDYIATADNGDDSSYYVDLGINSSNFNDPVSYPGYGPNDSYVHNHGGNLILNPETAGKTIKLMVGGTDNSDVIANVSSTGIDITGVITANGNITGGNLNTAGQVVATGNVTGGNVSTAGQVTATGNVTGGNLVTGGRVVATGNIVSSANIAGGNLAVTGTITSATLETTGNVLIGGNLTVQGNIQYVNVDDLRVEDPIIIMGTGPNGAPLTTDDGMDRGIYMEYYKTGLGNSWMGWQNSSGNMIAAANVSFSANNVVAVNDYGTFQAGNIYSQSAVAVGNITGGNLGTAGQVAATGNVTGGNVNTAGQVVATGNITGGNLITAGLGSFGTTVTATGNITGGNISTAGQVTATGNVTGGNLVTAGLGSFGTTVTATGNVIGGNIVTAGQVSATGNVNSGNVNTGIVSATGNINGTGAVFSGNVTAANFIGNISGNIDAGGANTNIQFNDGDILAGSAAFTFDKTTNAVVATGNVTAGNVLTGGLVSATGNVSGGNLVTAGLAAVTGNITGGNINTAGQVVATGNVNGGNVVAVALVSGANVSATSNVTGANVVGTTSGKFANIGISASSIDSDASRITINGADADVDFAVDGDTVANVFYIDAGTGTASFGTSTQTTNAVVAFNASNSILLPVGNTSQRPSTGVTGMLRFNNTLDVVEVYDADSWTTVGSPSFTVVTDDQFTGNGAQVVYTLANAYTTNSVIVSINGVVQIPTTAYSVSGNTLTFTEAPQQGDFIDVRGLTTTTQVTSISNSPGTAIVSTNPTLNEVNITGNLLPVANNVQSLGSQTLRWKELYVAGNSIYLGNIVMKNLSGNTVAFFGPDGTTPATIDSTNVDTTTITNGTSNVSVASSGGNVRFNIGGTSNVMVVSATGAAIVGDLSVTGNATLSGNILGDRVQNGTTSFDIQTQNGNANITVAGTSNVAVFSTAGANITGNLGVTGNITGSYILGNGSLLTGIDATSIQSGTSNVRVQSSGGNISVGVGGSAILRFTTAGIVNDMGNGVGNIGNATGYFNTAFVKSTSAQYADLAENYCADAEYAPGTVLSFGGDYEVTISAVKGDRRIAGVVSTNPSYIMNSTLECEFTATVALTGRVPTKVIGPVQKGDMIISAGNGRAMACTTPAIGTVIGKALQDHDSGEGVIEVVVGRL